MKYCVHGLGFMAECGRDATQTRDGWPLCDEHAAVWDAFERMAEEQPDDAPDFVKFAREHKKGEA